ncbi:LNS2 domain-containing protein [[Clostridium] fimetarium]|uniref:Uncharacterized protein n=1 Tax=[Clostridium] fimetarium TaxID=99656 RepID=A0A1I0RSB6_9FIRM|nr:hypothetical protein [[Clostridium] fimetarium]SEW44253.1 hypothetical protein SAMN05421659_12222 [[Clostridium] fimetarium]
MKSMVQLQSRQLHNIYANKKLKGIIMRKNLLNENHYTDLSIMLFVEGTIIKPKSWFSLYNHNAYIPIGNAVKIIKEWEQQGANIIYCTSRKKRQADDIATLLKRYGFAGSFLVSREQKESYKDIVEMLQPDILIEDDCKSIGGVWQMCITKVNKEIKENILSIVVSEFKGIDNLPTDIERLKAI